MSLSEALDSLCEAAGLKPEEVGTIRVYKQHSRAEFLTSTGVVHKSLTEEKPKPKKTTAKKATAKKD